MLLKDHLATYAGVRHTSGSRYLRDHVAASDSELVARYKRGGLIPAGTTATCELALLSTAESARYGPCRNPWDLARTTGGSSGGSGAAVAAGAVPIAHGNDAGGSIRIPASCCGLFGLKPTRARNPLGPAYGDLGGGIWAEHVLTRSVRDSAAALEVTAGPMPGDPYFAPPASGSFLGEVGEDPGRLRIAVCADAPTGVPVHEDCREALREAAALLELLGHDVEEAPLPVDGALLEEAFFVIYAAGTAWRLDAWRRELGREPEEGELEPFTVALAELGRSYSASDFLTAIEKVQADARRIAASPYAIHATPTLAAPPVPLGHFAAPAEDPLRTLRVDAAFAAFTWVANATGQPAMSVPLHWNAEGLPIGVHFTAALGAEALLIRLAAQLEEARPWAGRRPPA
jgi:amidase